MQDPHPGNGKAALPSPAVAGIATGVVLVLGAGGSEGWDILTECSGGRQLSGGLGNSPWLLWPSVSLLPFPSQAAGLTPVQVRPREAPRALRPGYFFWSFGTHTMRSQGQVGRGTGPAGLLTGAHSPALWEETLTSEEGIRSWEASHSGIFVSLTQGAKNCRPGTVGNRYHLELCNNP